MKKISLFSRTLLFIVVLFLLNIFYIIKFCQKEEEINHYLVYAILGIITSIIILLLFYATVICPYQNNQKLYTMFLEGRIYEELFDNSSPLTRQYDLVMDKFHQLLNKQDAIALSKKQAEYLALQNQINPHFLYNTLEAIRGDAIYAGLTSIAETTEALSSFFRYTITEVKSLVTLADELENAENYFRIQQYRFNNRLQMILRFPENDENVNQLHLPKLTLQPIIENAVFHGLEGKADGGCIVIQIETTKKNLLINISDNGFGISPQQLNRLNASLEEAAIPTIQEEIKTKGGIALRNVSQRIKLLFGEDYGIHIYSAMGHGTDVHITLPKITE